MQGTNIPLLEVPPFLLVHAHLRVMQLRPTFVTLYTEHTTIRARVVK